MQPRIDVTKYLGSGVGRAMLGLSRETEKLMDKKLFHLIEIRASQLNGCAYCIDMHTKDARLAGETEQRIYALSAWHETPFFTDRERAAHLWNAIDELPDKLRVAIVLAGIEGHNTREIAALLEIPEGTVRSRLFLARKALAEKLQWLTN